MTVEDLIGVLLEIIPNAKIETDAHGELVIYTGLKMPEDGRHLEIGEVE